MFITQEIVREQAKAENNDDPWEIRQIQSGDWK